MPKLALLCVTGTITLRVLWFCGLGLKCVSLAWQALCGAAQLLRESGQVRIQEHDLFVLA
jgi:hypothetical protein